jgi:hydrogenase nickel incorporation protein HypB
MHIAARSGDGMQEWLGWLAGELAAQRDRLRAGASLRPAVQPDGAHLHGAQS